MRLSIDGCRSRQGRLIAEMEVFGVSVGVMSDPAHVLYLTGFETPPGQRSALLLDARGTATLFCGTENPVVAADEVRWIESSYLATAHLDHGRKVADAVRAEIGPVDGLVGLDRSTAAPVVPELAEGSVDLCSILWQKRRRKDPDELELLRKGIEVSETCYERARELIEPGVSELELYAELYKTAVVAAGEKLPALGNDFQCASPGGPPRLRATQGGELFILDLGVRVGGYNADSCRTFKVAETTRLQDEAWECLVETLRFVEGEVVPGYSCRRLYQKVKERLDRVRPESFFHHLGHGIGLSPHERPSLNPHWNQMFEEGDVFTVEPGLYGEELAAGIRLEEVYRVTATGIEKLTSYPLNL